MSHRSTWLAQWESVWLLSQGFKFESHGGCRDNWEETKKERTVPQTLPHTWDTRAASPRKPWAYHTQPSSQPPRASHRTLQLFPGPNGSMGGPRGVQSRPRSRRMEPSPNGPHSLLRTILPNKRDTGAQENRGAASSHTAGQQQGQDWQLLALVTHPMVSK